MLEEANNRHLAAWLVDLSETLALCSAQWKGFLRLIYGTTWSVNKVRVSFFELNHPFLFC
ncbi:hypothetical protein N8608_02225 [bacterium]|nr:hypothetical protein [bacterium]